MTTGGCSPSSRCCGPTDEGSTALSLVVVDTLVGVLLCLSAVVVATRRSRRTTGRLLGLAGVTWFAGTVWPPLNLLHRGPLVHALLSSQPGRIGWWPAKAVVVLAYASAIPPLSRSDEVTLGVAIALAGVTLAQTRRPLATRGLHLGILAAALVYASALALGAANRMFGWEIDRGALWCYLIAVAAVAIALSVDVLRGTSARGLATNLVVELGERLDNSTLTVELGRVLGDRSLQVGYWLPHRRHYVDDAGHVLDLAMHGRAARTVTPIEDAGQPLAMLIHDPGAFDEPGVMAAVAAAARVAVTNVRLQDEARERVQLIAASRRRLVEAVDFERRKVEAEIRGGVQVRLDEVSRLVSEVQSGNPGWLALEAMHQELNGARQAVIEVARGIHPHALTEGGLPASIPELAQRAGIPVEVDVRCGRLPPAIEAAIHFVCSEALSNVTKHADATCAVVEVAVASNVVTLSITDDGSGGVDLRRGSGLRGLVDRVDALGGRLEIRSSASGGTQVAASLPMTDPQQVRDSA
jgi:hypothetical protein